MIDSNNNFNTATGLYTAPIAGFYFVSAQVSVSTITLLGSTTTLNVIKNGTAITGLGASQQLTVTASSFMLGTTGIVSLAAGDTLGVQLTATGNDTVQANTAHITVFLLFV